MLTSQTMTLLMWVTDRVSTVVLLFLTMMRIQKELSDCALKVSFLAIKILKIASSSNVQKA